MTEPATDPLAQDAANGPRFQHQIHFFGSDRGVLGLREIMVFGLGDGEALSALFDFETDTGPISQFIEDVHVLEPDEDVRAAWVQANTADGKWERSFPIHLHSTPEAFDGAVIGALHAYFAGAALVDPATKERHPELAAEFDRIVLEAESRRAIFGNTAISRSKNFTLAILRNLAVLPECVEPNAMKGRLAGRPAFIVAAGPSLDRNVALLPEARRRGPLLVANTAVPAVAEHTRIDCMVSIENDDVVISHYRDHLDQIDCRALGTICGNNQFRIPGPKIAYFTAGDPNVFLAEALGVRTVAAGPSVTTAAFGLAWLLGADPIVLVGQDCAMTGGRTHGNTTAYKGRAWPGSRDALRVPAWGGEGEVQTRQDLLAFARWFESMAEGAPGQQRRLVNCTEGGMSLAGWEEIPLAVLLAELPEQSPVSLAEGPTYSSEKCAEARAALLAEIRAAKEALAAFVVDAQERGVPDAAAAFDEARAVSRWVDAHATRAFHAILTAPDLADEDRYLSCCWAMLESATVLEGLLAEP